MCMAQHDITDAEPTSGFCMFGDGVSCPPVVSGDFPAFNPAPFCVGASTPTAKQHCL